MADISKIKLINGTTVNLKDNNAIERLTINNHNINIAKRDGTNSTITIPHEVLISETQPINQSEGDIWLVINEN